MRLRSVRTSCLVRCCFGIPFVILYHAHMYLVYVVVTSNTGSDTSSYPLCAGVVEGIGSGFCDFGRLLS